MSEPNKKSFSEYRQYLVEAMELVKAEREKTKNRDMKSFFLGSYIAYKIAYWGTFHVNDPELTGGDK